MNIMVWMPALKVNSHRNSRGKGTFSSSVPLEHPELTILEHHS